MVPMAFFSMNFMFKKMGESSIIECLQLWSFESMEYGFLSTYFVWTYVFSCIFHRVALTNLQPNYSDKKSRRCGTSHGGQIILAGQNLGKGFHVYSPAENKGGRFGLQVLCRLVHGGLYRWRENSLAFFLYQKLKEILTRYSRTISKAWKNSLSPFCILYHVYQ